MRQDFDKTPEEKVAVPDGLRYLVGGRETLLGMWTVTARTPFNEEVLEFLNDVSRALMTNREAKLYSDIITFAFWIRRSSTTRLKERFGSGDENIHLGRGVVFHIAPSNVPVNYAYSLAVGLLTGNANVVRVPSKDFIQVRIINQAIASVLSMETHAGIRSYICLVRYDRSREINDLLSAMAAIRVIWGGDATIAELRKSPLGPRAGEITFADRFSLAVIDSESYLERVDKHGIAEDFYNDTYLTDQNACTSPRMVVWLGKQKEKAKEIFWGQLHETVKRKYTFQSVQGINKLTSGYLLAAAHAGVQLEERPDNLIVRAKVSAIPEGLMELKDNSGYFFEYDCGDILELRELCDDLRCQTIAYIGDKGMFAPLLASGVKGIDRIVPIGQTMDFDFIWDGYNLYERMTRIIVVRSIHDGSRKSE